MLKKMQMQKGKNQFIQKIEKTEEELGPKCVVCQEGYTKKQTEILGMYVFNKKLKIAELTP